MACLFILLWIGSKGAIVTRLQFSYNKGVWSVENNRLPKVAGRRKQGEPGQWPQAPSIRPSPHLRPVGCWLRPAPCRGWGGRIRPTLPVARAADRDLGDTVHSSAHASRLWHKKHGAAVWFAAVLYEQNQKPGPSPCVRRVSGKPGEEMRGGKRAAVNHTAGSRRKVILFTKKQDAALLKHSISYPEIARSDRSLAAEGFCSSHPLLPLLGPHS